MKKIYVCLAAMFALLIAYPAQAKMEFYQAEDGSIIVEGTCEDVSQFTQLFDETTDDDTTGQSDTPSTDPQEDPQEDPQVNVPKTFHEQEFHVAQSHLIAYVRDVNWKTGYNLTLRDANWINRLKMVCTGAWNYSKPFRVQLEAYDPNLDQHFQQVEDAAFDALAKSVTNATFHKAAKLSLRGVYNAVITEHPFLLLIINEDTYQSLVEEDPQIQDLADNMYKFFVYRAAYMGTEYDSNTDELVRVYKIGKGDALHTWAVFAQFAEKMYQLDTANKLTVEQEKNIHIWKLNSILEKIRRKVQVEKRAAKIAAKDPQNKQWLNEQNETNAKKPSVDQEARKLLQTYTEAQIKALISKYLGK